MWLVARDNVRAEALGGGQRAVHVLHNSRTSGAEILTTIQVGGLIIFHGVIVGRQKVRIARGQIFICGIRPMATVAICLRVHYEASQSNQVWIFALHIDEGWCDV